ncbi:BIR protein, partial [Plasmodium berghei]
MDTNLCNNFIYVTTNLEYDSNNKNYKFNDDTHFKTYCTNSSCDSDLEKVNAGCLYFFKEFFGSSELFKSVAKSNIDTVEYIMIWLSYMLSLKNNDPQLTNLEHFYKTYIEGTGNYKETIANVTEYKNYKDLIDTKKYYLKMDNNIIFKFYDAFKLLCEMYSAFDGSTSNCTNCSGKANQFVEEYKNLKENSSVTKNSSYSKVLSILSTDYNSLKNKCNDTLSFPSIETTQNTTKITEQTVQNSAQTSEVTSSSSIGDKLIPVLSIFGAIAFFLGIGYKVNNNPIKIYSTP